MRYMVIGYGKFCHIPLSITAGLLTEGLYVSPGSVYFYTHPVLEVSAVMLTVGIIALFAFSVARERSVEKFRRNSDGPTLFWFCHSMSTHSIFLAATDI